MFATRKREIEEARKGISTSVSRYMHRKYIEFDFVGSINEGLPMIYIAISLFTISPFILLPIIIVTLYIFAIIDKYRIINFCSVFTSKSADYMLRAFRIYRWTPLLIVWGGSIMFYDFCFNNDIDPDSFVGNSWGLGIIPLIMVAATCYWPKEINVKFRERFNQRHAWTSYDSISKEFSSLYRQIDPYMKIKDEQI